MATLAQELAESSKTGLIYDVLMTKHQNEVNPNHPEAPERIALTWKELEVNGLMQRCQILKSREATEEDILRIHSEEHLSTLASTPELPQDQLNLLSQCYSSIFINPHTFTTARLAAGCVIELTEGVVSGKIGNGLALVRPPGHHAECSMSMGFCHFSNVAIATKYALDNLGIQRVLVIDWDIHHGNGTQHQFYEDNRVLYFSLHRYDNGMFFPCADDANFDYVGAGAGKGFNINVAWNDGSKGDMDYLLAFHHILMPVALEFDPELVMVSCGFDAGLGDCLGGYQVTPAGYAHMTRLLMALAGGRVVLALEGGYSLSCLKESTSAIVSVLLGDAPLPELNKDEISSSTLEALQNTISAHSQYWKSLNVFGTEVPVPGANVSAVVKKGVSPSLTPEMGGIPASFGRANSSKSLEEVLPSLRNSNSSVGSRRTGQPEQGDQSSTIEESHDQPSGMQEGSHDQPSGMQEGPPSMQEGSPSMQEGSPSMQEGSHDQPSTVLEGSHDQPQEGSHDQPSTMQEGSHDQPSTMQEGSHEQPTTMQEGSRDQPSTSHDQDRMDPATVKDLIMALEQEGHTTMFAVAPKPWCEHLASHVKPLPPAGIDSAQLCETCGEAQEPWVCLSCYHVFCGRFVNEHMVVHQDATGHKVALSLADLSVWCYLCDSYISNHVLNPAINSAHRSKFGSNVGGSR